MKKFIAGIFFSLIGFTSWSQQDAMFSQYMFNGLYVRKQWVNFPGAPSSATIAMDGPVYGNPMGLGFIASYDQIGVTCQTDFFLNYSYNVKIAEGKLFFGVKAGVSQYNANLDQLIYWDQADQVFNGNITKAMIPKFGFGAYYQQSNWYAGISAPTLFAHLPGNDFNANIEKSTSLRRHYYANAGYIYPLSEEIKLKPSVLVKYLPGVPVQADLNIAALFRNMLWTGISFRTGDAIAGIIEYQANMHFRIGYAYDFTFSGMRYYSAGTHELMLGYDFGKDFIKVKTPRFF
jgi:type IX secretion system PorP/SprF family membrane protein